jgi:hypothetical protein
MKPSNSGWCEFARFSQVFGIVWAIMFLLGLGLIGGLVYVAIHFLAKVW